MRNKWLATIGLSAVLIAAVSSVQAGVIYSDANDGMIEDIGGALSVHPETFGNWQTTVGEWYGNIGTVVIPFELPNLGATVDPFITADLGVAVNGFTAVPTQTDIDLYGVRVDASPLISTSDAYSGAAIDAGATLIQQSFLTPSTPAGWSPVNNNTDAAGDAALTSFLNSSYDGGAGAGQFVFLRLSYGADTVSGSDNYNIDMREAGNEGEWPVITYDAIPEPATLGLLGLFGGAILFMRRRFII